MNIVKISDKAWYDAIEFELEAGTIDYESADEAVYRHFKKLHGDNEIEIPHNAKREKEIKDWLRDCDG